MNMFYKDPSNDHTAKMRDRVLRCKFDQYLNALAHIMNTGKNSSCFSNDLHEDIWSLA